MLEPELESVSTEKLICYPRACAWKFSVDQLLDALSICEKYDDSDTRRNALYNILSIQSRIFGGNRSLWLCLDWVLDKFFSRPDPRSIIKNFIVVDNDSIDDEDSDVAFENYISENDGVNEISDENIELLFKRILLEFCTLVVENEPLSDKIISFAYELNIDLSNIYFLNKLKNDLMFDLRYFYDTDNDRFEALSDEDINALWLLKSEYDLIIQFRIDNPERYSWKNIKSWCSAMWDELNYGFFGDDVVEYEEWDDFIPLDCLCYKDDNSLSENDRWVEFDFDEDKDKFFVCTPTYKKNTADSDEEPNYCRFVDIKSYLTGNVYTVLSR